MIIPVDKETKHIKDDTQGYSEHEVTNIKTEFTNLRGVEWVHGLFLFPLVLGKM